MTELKAMGILTRADRDALAAYCRFVVQFTEASARFQREPLVVRSGDSGASSCPFSIMERTGGWREPRGAVDRGPSGARDAGKE